jgi:acetyl-CoA carboxylase biotin carboxyl carrier protein
LTEIRSPIAGTVFKLIASVGDEVAVDQLVALIDSMKLEIAVESDVAGTVRAVRVAEGDAIAEGDAMFDVA